MGVFVVVVVVLEGVERVVVVLVLVEVAVLGEGIGIKRFSGWSYR